MAVEAIGAGNGKGLFFQVVRWLGVTLVALTVAMIILWPHQSAHRSVTSFVVTLLWTLVAITLASMMIAGPDPEPEGVTEGEP